MKEQAQGPARIGVFDSGVGGLSVTREILAQLPGHPVVYLADQARAPYGQRGLEEIRILSGRNAAFLIGQGADVVVLACNTASAAALRWLRRRFPDRSFVGMEPALKPAAERTRSGRVGVLATTATFQGELFASLMDRFAGGVSVHCAACPDLVPLVEAGDLGSERARAALRAHLAPLLAAGVDQLVLGCTHYPFLRPLLAEVAGPGVDIIDPAPAVARQVRRLLEARGAPAGDRAPPRHAFFTTGPAGPFAAALNALLGRRDPVAHVDLDDA